MIIPTKNIMCCRKCHGCYFYINNTTRKTKELNIDLRPRIIKFQKLGNYNSIISNQLAMPRSIVQFVIKKIKQFGTTENLPGRGRKPKLSPRNARKLCREVNIKPRVVLKNIAKCLGLGFFI